MSYTLIMTWDIKENMEQEYFEFIVSDWVPTTTRLDLKMAAVWLTHYSADHSIPTIRAEGLVDDLDSMRKLLDSADWASIQDRLMKFVLNYQQKIVETTGEFQI